MVTSPRRLASLGGIFILLCSFFSVGMSPPAAAADVLLSIRAAKGTSVVQGAPFRFVAELENVSDSSATVDVTFGVHQVGGHAPPVVHFQRETQVVPAGAKIEYRSEVVPSQWFPGLGRFRVVVEAEGVGSAGVRFDVTRSPIRVPRFNDVTETAGVATSMVDFSCADWSAGAAWGDIDLDGDEDLFLPRRDAKSLMWVNNEGVFTEEAAIRGLEGIGPDALGAVFADYDNDGDQDLYVASNGPNQLLRNNGGGMFEDVTAAAGVGDPGPSQSASWGDYDNDGFLDLYVSNHGRCGQATTYYADVLYHNEGDGTFTDATAALHAEGSTLGAGFQAVWFDYDMDNDVDLYLANDFWGPQPQANVMWRNDGPDSETGWKFSNVSVDSNTALTMNSMGLGVSDYDRDMDLDFAISNIYEPVLLRNEGDGTFVDRAAYARVDRRLQTAESRAITWGLLFADLNNDGWEDLFLAAGRLQRESTQMNALYTNSRDGRFLDHSAPSRADDDGVGRGVAAADYDSDGRVDLFVVNHDGQPRLLRNVTSKKRAHWLDVDLTGVTSNRDGCGARLTLVMGKQKLLRQVFCGIGLASGSSTTVHFGIGNRTSLDRLEIKLPSGTKQVVRNVPIDRTLDVEEPSDT
jgi:hypothetical protein